MFPSYFNNCQSSCFCHHILWQFATFSINSITVLVSKLSKTKKKPCGDFKDKIINYPIVKQFIQVSMQITYLEIQVGIFSCRNVHITNKSLHIYFSTYFNLSQHLLITSDIYPMWPWNLTDDLEKQPGTSSMPHQELYIISSPYVNSNPS